MPFGMDMYYRREGANNANGLGGVCNAGGGCDLAQFLGSSGRRPCSLLLHRSGTNKDLGCTISLPCSPPSPASVRPPFQPRCLLSPRLASRVVSKVHSSNWLLQLRSSQVRLTPESGRRICPWGTKQPPKGQRGLLLSRALFPSRSRTIWLCSPFLNLPQRCRWATIAVNRFIGSKTRL